MMVMPIFLKLKVSPSKSNWIKPKQVNEIQNPWSFCCNFDNYTKLNERKYFSFVDGVQEITGVKQVWSLKSLIRLEGFEINMDKALLNNKEVEVKEESKEERYLRMVAPGKKSG